MHRDESRGRRTRIRVLGSVAIVVLAATGAALAAHSRWFHVPVGRVPRATSRLLFLDGRATAPLEAGGSAWADVANGRVVLFDDQARIARTLDGSPDGRRVLAAPLAAVAVGGDVLAAEGDGAVLRFRDGAPDRWIRPRVGRGVVGAATHGLLVARRPITEVELAPVQHDEPLLWVLDADGRVVRTIGAVDVPPNAFLGQLVNAGSVATDDEGNIYFAFALRPEVRRYRPDGRLEWVTSHPLSPAPPTPTLVAPNGTLEPRYTVVQHAITVGPDRRLYVLGSNGDSGRPDRVYMFDADGRLRGESPVVPYDAVVADDRGRLTTIARSTLLARRAAHGPDRMPFTAFALPSLAGADSVRLDDFARRVVVVSFWASWCAPCRREMPQLNALASELAQRGVSVIGLNEDADVDAARRFATGLRIRYPNAMGKGRLRDQYGYRGLPYTVVLDRQHRVVRAMYGFGESIEPLRDVLIEELARTAEETAVHHDPAPRAVIP